MKEDEQPTEITTEQLGQRLASIDHFSMMICAPRRSGKTWLSAHLLWELDEYKDFDMVMLFSGTAFNGQWKMIPKKYKFEGWNNENAQIIENVMNRQRDIIELNESTEEPDQKPIPRILMIFDDIMGGSEGNLWQGKKANTMQKIFYMGRHLHISTIVILQKFKGMSTIRSNADILAIFRTPSHIERRDTIDAHLSCESCDPEQRRKCERFYENCFKTKHHCCIIDLAGSHGMKCLKNYCYSLLAPSEETPNFGMGPEHHWSKSSD